MVRKAVIPAAGLGTRFLPATKATPKEMIPLVDKPGIQWVVEEAVRAGITDVLIVTGRGKKTIEDHFGRSLELEAALERAGKPAAAAEMRAIAELATIHYVCQPEPRGLGHAVGLARDHVGDEPFVVLLPDDVMVETNPILKDMIAAHARTGGSVIALKTVDDDEVSLYGAVVPEVVAGEDRLVRIRGMVEKPAPLAAPSRLGIMGRYLLVPAIFDCIDRVAPGAGGEIQLTDAMAMLAAREPFYGLPFTGGRYDTGNKLDWLRATVEVALQHPELGGAFRAALRDIAKREGLV
jgi:UTP--glucose-1-phosphate uridylyltransferase